MTVNNWENDQTIALYKREIADLHKELKNVYNINEEHRILNGELRESVTSLTTTLEKTMDELEMALNIIHYWSKPVPQLKEQEYDDGF